MMMTSSTITPLPVVHPTRNLHPSSPYVPHHNHPHPTKLPIPIPTPTPHPQNPPPSSPYRPQPHHHHHHQLPIPIPTTTPQLQNLPHPRHSTLTISSQTMTYPYSQTRRNADVS